MPDDELAEVRRHLKRQLASFARERARTQLLTNKRPPVQVVAGGVLLDPSVLTIGFARPFPTYQHAPPTLRAPPARSLSASGSVLCLCPAAVSRLPLSFGPGPPTR